jgi:hypothetical protein
MYNLPFQNNIYGGAGPKHYATANVLNIQPVIAITVGDWNIISRTIAPLIYLPSLTTGPSEITDHGLFSSFHFGLGDINQTFYFSPADKALGDRDPGAPAVFGGGSLLSPECQPAPAATLRQLQHGRRLVSDELADHYRELGSDIRKQVGFSNRRGHRKDFRIGAQPMNASLQAFDYVQSPTGGPRWTVRAQLQFLFPR